MVASKRVFRYSDGVIPNILGFAYTFGGWLGGIAILALVPGPWKIAGAVLTFHALVISAYYVHEFAHHAVFVSPQTNDRWGALMSWINGACYARFADLRNKHVRHHVDRADVLTYDYKALLRRRPALRRAVIALEWAYIPAVELIMHGYVMALPFIAPAHRNRRPRVIFVTGVRLLAFAALGWASPAGLLGYALAYLGMLHVLRFTDAYQHTYDAFAVLQGGEIPADKLRDRAYEQRHTYSNVVLRGNRLADLLILNFSYHNAHHERPIEPWHRLPTLHERLFPADYAQVLPMASLLAGYHRYRVRRLVSADYGEVRETADGRMDPSGFFGAVGVSFLTAV
jgi:fatty acid desaturase